MTRLGSYASTEVMRAFQNAGWKVVRQKGSHVCMEKPGHEATLTVPMHKGKDVKKGTLRNLIKDAEMTIAEFLEHI